MANQDQPVMAHNQDLVAEEHRLFEQDSLDAADQKRLADLQVELDQCWDLLRQRRARREFGENPDQAQARSPEVVEKYVG